MSSEIDKILELDAAISTAPEDSPSGNPQPADSDFQIYIPQSQDGPDASNQHFLTLPLPNGDFWGVWTMSTMENTSDQHLATARSSDKGKTWTRPDYFAGVETCGYKCSWAFPFLVPHTGRLYVFYNEFREPVPHGEWPSSRMVFRYSDDFGYTWSDTFDHLRIEPNSYSPPGEDSDPSWIVYQPPIVTTHGDVIAGFTHSRYRNPGFMSGGGTEVRFLRFDNILTETDASKLRMNTLPEGGADGLRISDAKNPEVSTLQEPTVLCLSDGRLLCVMRSSTGYVIYSVSADRGSTWSQPDVLRYCEGGPGIKHPLSPCPLYKLRDGRFVLIFANNLGDANGGRYPEDWCRNRRPVYLTVGREVPHAKAWKQPIMFGYPRVLADNDRIPITRKQLTEIGTYPSLFESEGKVYFFFPDRKHYLLGKILTEELLSDFGLPR